MTTEPPGQREHAPRGDDSGTVSGTDATPQSESSAAGGSVRRTVLLIEDSRTDARLITTYLNAFPTPPALTHCRTLKDALDLSELHFDVVLTDLNLPDSEGPPTVTSVVSHFPSSPVIALTADESRGVECISAGAQDFLPKDDVDSRSLYRAIEYAVLRWEQNLRAKYQSSHDPLTGLLNRAAFEESANHVLRNGGQQATYLLFLDVDRFKFINDNHGHAAGDRVLVGVADRLLDAVRSSDLVARWGGDEFTVLGQLEVSEFEGLQQRVRQATRFVVEVNDEAQGPQLLDVELSLGGAITLADTPSFTQLLHDADTRMYEHKQGKSFNPTTRMKDG